MVSEAKIMVTVTKKIIQTFLKIARETISDYCNGSITIVGRDLNMPNTAGDLYLRRWCQWVEN